MYSISLFFFKYYGDHRVLPVSTHSFPTLRSSDLVLALPFVLLMGGLALLSLNWREFFAWSAVTLIFAIALWFHAHVVWSVTTLSDPVSPGWNTGGGWRFVVAAVQKATMFNLSPVAITPLLVPLSLLGWAAMALWQRAREIGRAHV